MVGNNWRHTQRMHFTYDNLKRLSAVAGTPASVPDLTMNYDDNGNINEKSDAGTFAYDPANRVSEINPYVNIPDATQKLTYTPFNKVKTINENGVNAEFTYWPDGARASMTIDGGQHPRTVYYAPDYEKTVDNNNNTKAYCYLKGEQGQIVAIIGKENDKPVRYYVLTDYLGSVTHILNTSGGIVAEKSYDAWGRYRNVSNWQPYAPTYASMTFYRGYTGHEYIPEFGIVNMNGRLYDPLLGRMFSPDPYIMGKDNSQGYNRYSYALNNPLSYTDPSGEFVWFVPLIYATVNVAVDLAINKGNMNFGQIALSAISGAAGGFLGGATTVGGAFLGAGLSQLNRLMPSFPIYQSQGFNLSLSPTIGFGSSGFSFGGSLNAGGEIGDFAYSASVGAGYNSGMSSLGDAVGGSGYWNIGGFAGYNDGHADYGLGYAFNHFGGNTSQGVGAVTAQIGDFGLRFDEDYGIGDGYDRYRTGGLLMTYRLNNDITLALGGSMMTGNAIKDGENPIDYCATCGSNGTWNNEDINLRGGTMYGGLIYKGQAFFYGSNSENRLHTIQNAIHGSKLLKLGTPYFKNLGYTSGIYSYYGSYNPSYLFY